MTQDKTMQKRERSKPNIGVVIYTHDRVVDATINIEIIRSVWQRSGLFGTITIVHAFNGQRSWYQKLHGEDVLLRRKNPGHFQGAADLIDAGMTRLQQVSRLDYIVVLAADTWLLKPSVLARMIATMKAKGQRLATCPWGVLRPKKINSFREAGMATDYFVLDAKWQQRYTMFPLRYAEFKRRNGEAMLYAGATRVMVEKLAWMRFIQAVEREVGAKAFNGNVLRSRVQEIYTREPVHTNIVGNRIWVRRHSWPRLGLVTHHDLKKKITFLRTVPDADGVTIRSLLHRKA